MHRTSFPVVEKFHAKEHKEQSHKEKPLAALPLGGFA